MLPFDPVSSPILSWRPVFTLQAAFPVQARQLAPCTALSSVQSALLPGVLALEKPASSVSHAGVEDGIPHYPRFPCCVSRLSVGNCEEEFEKGDG